MCGCMAVRVEGLGLNTLCTCLGLAMALPGRALLYLSGLVVCWMVMMVSHKVLGCICWGRVNVTCACRTPAWWTVLPFVWCALCGDVSYLWRFLYCRRLLDKIHSCLASGVLR
jgi:hypothetical protein